MRVRPAVIALSLSQLIGWGTSYYAIGVFGDAMARDLGWSLSVVHGGFSVALLVMGLCSPIVGALIDRHGGRAVMSIGSLVSAAACLALATVQGLTMYYAAWVALGVAMRLTLYDAAFAALVRIEGPHARRSISQVTLMGGLAATVFWPLGQALQQQVGWRGALLAYAACALATVPLHLVIPDARFQAIDREVGPDDAAPPESRSKARSGAVLFGTTVALVNFLNSGLSAHMIAVLTGFGLAAATAVWIAALRGIGQSSARLGEVMRGAAIHPLQLQLGAALVLPICFAIGFLSGRSLLAAAALAFLYGAGNGLLTITRGTVPTVLFDLRRYGTISGRVLAPSFVLSAAAPVVYALLIDYAGAHGALALSLAVSLVVLAASAALQRSTA